MAGGFRRVAEAKTLVGDDGDSTAASILPLSHSTAFYTILPFLLGAWDIN